MKRQTFIEYSKVIVAALTITFVTAIFCILQTVFENKIADVSSKDVYLKNITVVIDAGHGGEDGGAVGVSGILEKDINLSVAKALYEMFSLTDIKVVMTRNDDNMLYSTGQESRKKFNDLNNRVGICKSVDNAVLISIHQNKFPIAKYKGLQVYYSRNNDDSQNLASKIQNTTAAYLQNDNKRQVKEAGRSIFILDKLSCPAVLVECGFLSNPEEEANLSNYDYQRKIAFVIFSSVMDFQNNDI